MRIKIFSAAVVCVSLFLSSNVRAHFPGGDLCHGMLLVREVLKGKFADRAAYEAFLQAMQSEPKHPESDPTRMQPQTVWVKKKIETESEKGPRYVLGRFDGKPWNSSFFAERAALQGDPRNFIKAVGIDVGRFFGYELLEGGTELIVPSPERVNWAVRTLREALQDRGESFDLEFFESHGFSSAAEFVSVFAREQKLPLGAAVPLRDSLEELSQAELNQQSLLVHDVAFHVAAIFIPGEIVRQSQRQMRAFLDYRDLCEKRGFPRESLFRIYSESDGSAIDYGTGNYQFEVKEMLQAKDKSEARDVARGLYLVAYDKLTKYGVSPKERLLDGVARHDKYDELKPVLEDFLKEQERDPEFTRRLEMKEADVYAATKRRYLRIEAAIRLIKAREKKKAGGEGGTATLAPGSH